MKQGNRLKSRWAGLELRCDWIWGWTERLCDSQDGITREEEERAVNTVQPGIWQMVAGTETGN